MARAIKDRYRRTSVIKAAEREGIRHALLIAYPCHGIYDGEKLIVDA